MSMTTNKGKFSPIQDIELVKKQIANGMTLSQLGEYYKIHGSSVGRHLRKLGIPYNLKSKPVEEKNHTFFKIIDSEIKAYLLGFFVGDGSVDRDSNRIKVSLAEQDREIIELFSKYISPNSKITVTNNQGGVKNKRQKQLSFKVTSDELVSDLAKYGIVPQKTFKPITIPDISDELKWHFLRGYFDADGTLWYKHRIKSSTSSFKAVRVSFTNGDRTILDSIREFVGHGTVRAESAKTSKFYHILYIDNKEKIMSIMSKMYEKATYKLSRKYEKFLYVNTELNSESKESESV